MTVDVNVTLLDFGNSPTREAVTENEDGSYSIFINARLSSNLQQEAYKHALWHIEHNDFEKDNVQLIEQCAHNAKEEEAKEKNSSVKELPREAKKEDSSVKELSRKAKKEDSPAKGCSRKAKEEDSSIKGCSRKAKEEDSSIKGCSREAKEEDSPVKLRSRKAKKEDSSVRRCSHEMKEGQPQSDHGDRKTGEEKPIKTRISQKFIENRIRHIRAERKKIQRLMEEEARSAQFAMECGIDFFAQAEYERLYGGLYGVRLR